MYSWPNSINTCSTYLRETFSAQVYQFYQEDLMYVLLDIWYDMARFSRSDRRAIIKLKLLLSVTLRRRYYVNSDLKTMNAWYSSPTQYSSAFQVHILYHFPPIVQTLTNSDPGSRNWLSLRWSLVITHRRAHNSGAETVFVLTDPRSLFTFSLESLFSSLPHFLNSHFQFIISFYTQNISQLEFIIHRMQGVCSAIICYTVFMSGEIKFN